MDEALRGQEGQGAQTPSPGDGSKRKLWIFAGIVVALFVIIPIIGVPAIVVLNSHQHHTDRLTAERDRPFALPFHDLRMPHGVAVDTADNLYVTDVRTNRVLELAAGSSDPTELPFTGLDLSAGLVDESTGSLAVDAAGNVYVTDTGHNRVVKLASGSHAQTVLPFHGLDTPKGVAVDAAGSVYVVDPSASRILKLAAGSNSQTALPPTGGTLGAVAVDTGGTVYISVTGCRGRSSCASGLKRLAPGSNTWTGVESPSDQQYVAVDTTGSVYSITTGKTAGVVKLAPGSDTWTLLPGQPRLLDPQGLAVDSRGNAYVTDHTGKRSPGMLFGMWQIGEDDAQGFVLKLPAG